MQYYCCMHKIYTISSVAQIIMGYTFREAIKEHREGSVYVVQARNINDQLVLTEQALTKINIETSHTKAFVQDGDVVISTRGSFKAAVLRSTQKIIASSSVYLLRLSPDCQILPEFLAIYLNSPVGQKEIAQTATSAAIKLILKKDLENIKIPVLSVFKQKHIIALHNNIKEQEYLLIRRNEINKNILDSTFLQLVRS